MPVGGLASNCHRQGVSSSRFEARVLECGNGAWLASRGILCLRRCRKVRCALADFPGLLMLNRRLRLPPPEPGPLEMDVVSSPEAQRAGTTRDGVFPVSPAPTGAGSAGAESGSDSAESRFIGVLRDAALPLRERRRAARALATSAAPEALEALREVLQEGPPELRAVIAEGLGLCPNPEARTLLETLTESPDEAAARGATRGWGAVGTPEAAQVLSGLLQASDRPEAVRTEAALALGEMPGVGAAYVALTNAAWQVKSPAVLAAALEGLGHRPISETQPFFLEYLADPLVSADMRVAAVESIGNAPDDPSSLLLEYAMDADPDVRAGAAWALSTTETPGDQGPALLELLRTEAEPDVRLRLYEALGNQARLDAAAVLQLVQQEPRTEVRIAGLVGGAVPRGGRHEDHRAGNAYAG